MKLTKPTIIQHGPVVEHDQCCAIYQDESAVFNMNDGVFDPSWKAQKNGWHLIHADTPWKRALVRLFLRR